MRRVEIFSIFEFLVIFFFLVFPPMLVLPENHVGEISMEFNLFLFLRILLISVCVYLLVFFIPLKIDYLKREVFFEKNLILKKLILSVVVAVLVFFISFIFESAARSLGEQSAKIVFEKKSLWQIILASIQIIVMASYEEIIYRKYLVNRFCNFFAKFKYRKICAIFLSAILFSLAHLYNGVCSILFALLSGLLFSVLYHFSKNIFYPILVHSIYNLVTFFISYGQ